MVLENIIYNQTILLTISVGIYILISQGIIPKFIGRRRIMSGIIFAFLMQVALISFAPQLGVELPTVSQFKLILFAAIGGAIVREILSNLIK